MAHANEAWQILSDPARRAAYDAQRDPIEAWARAERDDVGNVGVSLPTGLRLIVVMTLVLLLVAFVSIVFIGFGRVGVAPKP
jgi:hypothetical protein